MRFESFLGNAKAVATVREMLASDRVPGALLFSGPEGVGKKVLALMLAKALNCERPSARRDDFCDQCSRCQKIGRMITAAQEDSARRREIKDAQRRVEGLTYFDVQLIEPLTRYVLIEQIRQLRQITYTRPFELPYRVFIIDEAQAIHWQAVDLLLKALEEPPETTKFVLVCPNRSELRPTIRSRCVHIPFAPVEESLIRQLLAEDRKMTKDHETLAARVAAGSVAAAKNFDLENFQCRRRPWLDLLDGIAASKAGASPTVDWGLVFDSTKELTKNRQEFEDALKIGTSLLRDLLLIAIAGPNADIMNLDLGPRLKSWAAKLGVSGIEQLKAGLDEAYRLQNRNVNQQLGLDVLAIDLATRPPMVGG